MESVSKVNVSKVEATITQLRGGHFVQLPREISVEEVKNFCTSIGKLMSCEVRVEYQASAGAWIAHVPQIVPDQPSLEALAHFMITNAKNDIASGRKNPPRPMNSWLIFRDCMHKMLKSQQADLSVQRISTMAAHAWRQMQPDQKRFWQRAADEAKRIHGLAFPGYKYTPRKPGQKKKRQSRKAAISSSETVFDATDSPTQLPLEDVQAAVQSAPVTAALRNMLLEDEFENLASTSMDANVNQLAAFREGANGDLTLPAINDN